MIQTLRVKNKEQFDRYKNALNNIIFTDYLNFYFYENGKLLKQIAIAKVNNGKIVSEQTMQNLQII